MVDIHSHLIQGVDDGPASIKDSVKMLLAAEKAGVTAIIATPHYHRNLFENEKVEENFRELSRRIQGFGVGLYLGNEVFCDPEIPKLAEGHSCRNLAGSKCLLIEFPFDGIPSYSKGMIEILKKKSITPVIAHPERNRCFIQNFDILRDFLKAGCLLQIDAASVLGVYGSSVRKLVKKLIKQNLAHFTASDAHCADDYTEWLPAARKQIRRWAGQEYADSLFSQNPGRLINSFPGG